MRRLPRGWLLVSASGHAGCPRADRRALLLAKVPHADGEPVVVDTVAAFGVSGQTARDWMKALVGYGYARQLDRKEGTGQPYEWVINDTGLE